MIYEVRLPEKIAPRIDTPDPCPCKLEPVKMTYRRFTLFWQIAEGDAVAAGDVLCEGEVEKKILEVKAPAAGIVSKLCIPDGGEARLDDLLCLIESSEV